MGQELVINAPAKTATPAPQPTPTTGTKTTTARLNDRKGPGMNYKILKVLDKGAKVTIYETKGEWVKIDKNSEQWCNKNWLK